MTLDRPWASSGSSDTVPGAASPQHPVFFSKFSDGPRDAIAPTSVSRRMQPAVPAALGVI